MKKGDGMTDYIHWITATRGVVVSDGPYNRYLARINGHGIDLLHPGGGWSSMEHDSALTVDELKAAADRWLSAWGAHRREQEQERKAGSVRTELQRKVGG